MPTNAVYSSRSTHCSHHVQIFLHRDYRYACVHSTIVRQFGHILNVLDHFLHQAGTDSAYHIISKETLGTQYLFKGTSEHPYGKHVEENVLEVGVHEHIGNQLEQLEVRCHEEMQSKDIIQVYSISFRHNASKEAKDVDDQ